MSDILFQYHKVDPTSWVYLSSLLMLGLFFKFGRFWSVRNLDLFMLIMLAPGLLLVQYGGEVQALYLRKQRQQRQPNKEPASSDPGRQTEPSPLAERDRTIHPEETASGGERGFPVFAQVPLDVETGDAETGDAETGDAETGIAGVPNLNDPGGDPDGDPVMERASDEGRVGRGAVAELTEGQSIARNGFLVLFAVGALVLVRTLIDPTMVRRPLLEPNLSTGGLTFLGFSLFIFLMANVLNSRPTADDVHAVVMAEQLLERRDVSRGDTSLRRHGPGYAVLNFVPRITTMPLVRSDEAGSKRIAYAAVARIMAILSHLAIVVGIVGIGHRHFDNIKMGIGAATLYLMLPYTAQMTGRVDHVLPAALLVWAVMFYRRPLVSGMFIGLAIGVVYYPLFLLPLWISFYWHRGLGRFVTGVFSMLAVLVISLVFISSDMASFLGKVQQMFGLWIPYTEGLAGIWGLGWAPAYRLPVLAGFIALCGSLALWPSQKNLGTLLSCSAAVMVATQFWHGFGGGTYIAWYLPLVLLTIFRPNLEDRVALSVLGEGWFSRRGRKRNPVRAT